VIKKKANKGKKPPKKLEEMQEELYKCYRNYYGSLGRRFKGLFSKNKLKRKTYRYLASQGLLKELKNLFR